MLNYLKMLSKKYNMPLENVFAIALNRYGVLMNNDEDKRLRFNLNILDSDIKTFFAIGVNTYEKSPFYLENGILYLEGEKVGTVSDLEKDTCLSTYFRNGKKAITFNSNSRSTCTGCKFCGTYSLTDEDLFDFSNKENIEIYFNKLLFENDIKSMEEIESVTICTGCFESEDKLIEHLLLVNSTFKGMGFKGDLNYIGSQLKDFKKIKMLSEKIKKFGIYLTLEKFEEREKFMRSEKADLTLDKAKELLEYASSIGITTTFLYILGLEDLKTIEKNFEKFKNSINKFPIVQIFQNYTLEQENYRTKESKEVEYYLKARKIIEGVFKNHPDDPKLWECYRSLYFNNKKDGLLKCKKQK